jgi:hypothetical protein
MSSKQIFQFRWTIPVEGFECIRASADEDRPTEMFLVERTQVGVPRTVKHERTLSTNSGLFLEFAKVDMTPDSITKFADSYGALGVGKLVTRRGPKTTAKEAYYGERLAFWGAEVGLLRRLLPLWDRKRKGEVQFRIADHAIYAEWNSKTEKGSEVVAFRDTQPEIYQELKDRPAEIERHYLHMKIDAKLKEHPTTVRLLRDREGRSIYNAPASLIAAIWLQFARAVEGNRNYRSCKTCGKWFEIGGKDGRRSDAETCDNSCRAAYPRRKK